MADVVWWVYIILYSLVLLAFILALIASSEFPEHPYWAAFLVQICYQFVILIVLLVANRIINGYWLNESDS